MWSSENVYKFRSAGVAGVEVPLRQGPAREVGIGIGHPVVASGIGGDQYLVSRRFSGSRLRPRS